MANPQLENGHSRIANELLEALSQINLSAYEWRVFMCVLRKTYGWNKKSDFISVSQIAEGAGLPRSHACRAKLSLLRKKLLIERSGLLGPNKDYDSWDVTNIGTVPKLVTPVTNLGNKTPIKQQKRQNVTNTGTVPKSVTGVTNSGNKTLPIQALQKTIKDTTTKDMIKTCVGDDVKLSSYNGQFFEVFWAEYPRKVGKKKCRQIWNRLKPSEELAAQIIDVVKAYSRTEQWQKDNGKFIPHPATWLNQARWEDDIQAKPEPKRGDLDWLPTEQEAEDIMREAGIIK